MSTSTCEVAGACHSGSQDVAHAAAQTIYAELRTQAIRALARADSTDLEVRRLAGQADKLRAVDGMGALEVKATVAAIKKEYSESADLFDRLLAMTSCKPEHLRRAIQVAALTGESVRLKNLYDSHLANQEMSAPWKREMCQLLGFTGWFRESVKLQEELQKAGEAPGLGDVGALDYPEPQDIADEKFSIPVFVSEMTTTNVLDDNSIADQEVADIFSRSIRYLRDRGAAPIAARTVSVFHEDFSSGLMVAFVVEGEPAQVSDAEWDLYGLFASEMPVAMASGAIALGLLACHSRGDADAN